MKVPKEHQQKVLAWAVDRTYAGLFLEMRLGKTLIAVLWTMSKVAGGKILVVAPYSVLDSWQDELEDAGIPYTLLTGTREQRAQKLVESTTQWHLVNYEGMFLGGHRYESGRVKIVPTGLAEYPWTCVILDESTRIKNPKSQITKICLDYLSQAPYRLALSGLPNPENPVLDFWCQMAFVVGKKNWAGSGNWWDFRKRTHNCGGMSWQWSPKPGESKRIRDVVAKDAYFLARKDAGIPDSKVYAKRMVQLPPDVRKAYNLAEKHYELPDLTETQFAVVMQTWLARISGGRHPRHVELWHDAKWNEIDNLIHGDLKGQRIVFWFRFNSELWYVKKKLAAAGYKVAGICGDTSRQARRHRRKSFNRGELDFICVQIKCGKYGLDMSGASCAVYFSNSYSSEERYQSEDRLIHMEKSGPNLIVDLVAENTVDEDVLAALREKIVGARSFNRRLLQLFKERIMKTKRGRAA